MGGVKKVQDTVTKRLEDMVKKGKDPRAFIARYVRPAYIDAQKKRFITDNSSEGSKWAPLNPQYAKYKLQKFSQFPGGGTKINIATGQMFNSLTLTDKNLANEIIVDKTWIVTFNVRNKEGVNYLPFVNDARPVLEFRREFMQDIRKKYTRWMLKEKI